MEKTLVEEKVDIEAKMALAKKIGLAFAELFGEEETQKALALKAGGYLNPANWENPFHANL